MAPICRWKLPDTVAFSINTSNAGDAGGLRLVSTGVNTSVEKEREYTPVSPWPLSSDTPANNLQSLAVNLVQTHAYSMGIDGNRQYKIVIFIGLIRYMRLHHNGK